MAEKKIQELAKKIQSSKSFILTTHKNCDADGLGSVLAFALLLKSEGRKVQAFCVDAVPQRYDFMNYQDVVQVYNNSAADVKHADLALIFDTNDKRLIEPLYSELEKKAKEIIFIDHHCPLEKTDSSAQFYIDENSASTGEICYELIEEMNRPVTQAIARAIYTSIIFDTHMFRSVKNLSKAFYTCSKLFHQIGINDIYEKLFCRYDKNAWEQLLKTLGRVQYNKEESIALIELSYKEFEESGVRVFHFLDFLELVMKRKSVLAGVLVVEKKPGNFKLSFRSKESVDVSKIAEHWGGGGHRHSAGAWVSKCSKEKILEMLEKEIRKA